MRLTKRRRDHRPVMNMTPMIDIVFLLIIFFMTVTQVSEISKERLELPELQGSQDQTPSVVTINVTEAGEFIIAGQPVSMGRLVALVEEEFRRKGRNPALLTVVVRSDRRGLSRATNEVMRALAQLGIAKVNIAVQASG